MLFLGLSSLSGQNSDPAAIKIAALKDTLLPKLAVMFRAKNTTPGDSVLIRVFKQEKQLELWVARAGNLVLLKTYSVCAASGGPGPKRKQGDMQVPEGIYAVDHFNPDSDFHLSFRVNYPNEADRYFADLQHPGGDIYVHGNCASIGCIAIRDAPIEEVFLSAWLAKEKGQVSTPIHIFPCRMTDENLRILYVTYPQHRQLWAELRKINDRFEAKPKFIQVGVDDAGRYFLRNQ